MKLDFVLQSVQRLLLMMLINEEFNLKIEFSVTAGSC